MGSLSMGMDAAVDLLARGGRMGIISFHSLEDRMVKQRFRSDDRLTVLTRKAIKPGQDEIGGNPRSRSARLRVAEKN
jgi:16S rRNA (cytosine1402-N4)-methyltransferase